MKNRLFLFACLLTLGLAACGPNDTKIKQEVTDKLASTAPTTTADVQKGVVTLSGEVADDATKTAAEEAAKSVKGVKSVSNNIMVTPAPVMPPPPVEISADDKIRMSIDSSIAASGVSGVTVSVMNGEVTLTGEVSKDDLKKARQAADQSKPKKVINKLTVKK
ncbi:BON domain-containing protein [Chitinophaga sedimenti]|uniref:BON domain-containing protein n=1 Tax=Chitinophaga sedimenti TaxID=2033606 RepID=UPI00200696B9|nr:BON domain-containing protein [Chitinophaga sedimenti]MCK7558862.1 BON domain-containing protein [Chitinophaga sedimenti]